MSYAAYRDAVNARLTGANVKAMVVDSTFTFDPATHVYVSDVSSYEVAGVARVSVDTSVESSDFDGVYIKTTAPITFSSFSATVGGVIIYLDSGDDASSPILRYVGAGGLSTTDGLKVVAPAGIVMSLKPQNAPSLFVFDADYQGEKVPASALVRPITGSTGTFTRSTTAPYFDEDGNYQTAAVDELIWTKSPSGRVLPTIYPSYTNEVTDNSDGGNMGIIRGSWGTTAISWNGFTLREFIPDTINSTHLSYVSYSAIANGDVICWSGIVKPLRSQTLMRIYFYIGGGTTGRSSGVFAIPLDGSAPTIPADDTWYSYLHAGSIPLANGYYYVWASVHLKDVEDNTSITAYFRYPGDADADTYAGDGSTPYWEAGAHCLFKNIIHPPAPVLTTGSAVTVSQDQLTFPFDVPFPEEGMTFAIEFERELFGMPSTGANYYQIGALYTPDTSKYSPLGFLMRYDGVNYWYSSISAYVNNTSSTKVMRAGEQLTLTHNYGINVDDGSVSVGDIPDRFGGEPVNVPEIRFWVDRYAPIWIKRYVIVKGIIDPAKLL